MLNTIQNPTENIQVTMIDQAIQKHEEDKAKEQQKLQELKGQIEQHEGLKVEIIGKWIWISGDTKPHKEELKELGCRWSSDKKMWYWRPAGQRKTYFKGMKKMDLDEIRALHGSTQIQ